MHLPPWRSSLLFRSNGWLAPFCTYFYSYPLRYRLVSLPRGYQALCRRCGSHSPSPLATLPYLDDGRSKCSTRYWLVAVHGYGHLNRLITIELSSSIGSYTCKRDKDLQILPVFESCDTLQHTCGTMLLVMATPIRDGARQSPPVRTPIHDSPLQTLRRSFSLIDCPQ